MCGIAGRMLREPGPVGRDLVELMDAQMHRGADSTGFALYAPPRERGLRGAGRRHGPAHRSRAISKIFFALCATTARTSSKTRPGTARGVVTCPCAWWSTTSPTWARWSRDADGMADRIEIQSVGRSLEVVKDTGGAVEVADRHGVRDFVGTHGLGHARLATESSVSPTASHPFWARPFPDVAIVHNGQITDYYLWRGRLERRGYRFMTGNDSELIAVWISDRMHHGTPKSEALGQSIHEIDGVFTYLIADEGSIGFAKDRWAIKPLVAMGAMPEVAVATEEQAVRRIYREEGDVTNYDGPGMTRTWRLGGTASGPAAGAAAP